MQTKGITLVALGSLVSAGAVAQVVPGEIFGLEGTIGQSWLIGQRAEGLAYSNLGTFSGQVYANGGTGAGITRLVADDIAMSTVDPHAGQIITQFSFTMANLNPVGTNVSVRPRVRFYENSSGTPGLLLGAFTFNPIVVNGGSVTTINTASSSTGYFTVPANSQIWAGITFDNGGGATATAAQTDLFGQGIFENPTWGSSSDLFFQTTSTGSFVLNNPAGSTFFFNGAPKANFGWSFSTPVPEPASLAALGLGIIALARKRRRK